MRGLEEQVELPDEGVQRLVHPTDLPGARPAYAGAWWLGQAASPTIFFLVGAGLWAVSDNPVTPVLAALVVVVAAGVASWLMAREAWAFIPRRRQDLGRDDPTVWRAAAAVGRALALVVGMVVVVQVAIASGVTADVAGYAVGCGIGVAVLLGVEGVWALRARGRDRTARPQLLSVLVSLAAVVGSTAYSSRTLLDTPGRTGWPTTVLALGAGTMIGVQLLWWLSRPNRISPTGVGPAPARPGRPAGPGRRDGRRRPSTDR